jgi:tetratricopeptide (TPR) repeat protein
LSPHCFSGYLLSFQNMLGKSEKLLKFIIGVFVLIFFGVFFVRVHHFYLADICFEESQDLLNEGHLESSLKKANCAVTRNPREPNYYRGRAKVYILLAANAQKEKVSDYKNLALSNLKKSLSLNPNNLVTIRNSVPLYYYLSIGDFSFPAGVDNWDEEFIGVTREFFAHAKNSYKTDVGVVSLVAKYEKKLGLYTQYNQSVDMVENLRPDLIDWYDAFR